VFNTVQITIFWDVPSCGVLELQRFERKYCFLLQCRRVNRSDNQQNVLLNSHVLLVSNLFQSVSRHIIQFCVVSFILTENWILPGGSDTTVRHNTQITHHAQTKHNTQYYTNKEGHTIHDEYDVNTIRTITNTIISIGTDCVIKLSTKRWGTKFMF
jgi:hypothetical protein